MEQKEKKAGRPGLIARIRALLSRKKPEESPLNQEEEKPNRIKKTCKECGKTFTVDPTWEHIPNYCKECRQRFSREKEERQRAGKPRQIRRTCRNCGKVFTFPSTLPHYPNYCSNCRKSHQASMKEKYGRPVQRQKEN